MLGEVAFWKLSSIGHFHEWSDGGQNVEPSRSGTFPIDGVRQMVKAQAEVLLGVHTVDDSSASRLRN